MVHGQLLDHDVSITSVADADNRRILLRQYIWGTSSLPTGLPSAVEINDQFVAPVPHLPWVTSLLPMPSLARMDTLKISMELNQTGYAHHFIPVAPNNRLIILHEGHDENFVGDHDRRAIEAFLSNGYSVLAVYMPHLIHFDTHLHVDDCSYVSTPPDPPHPPTNNPLAITHDQMFATLTPSTGNVVKFFLEPIAVSLNYLKTQSAAHNFPVYEEFAMTGLSGGGWATTVYAAIDPTIKISVPVAGTMPRYLRGAPGHANYGDMEQQLPGLYAIANYLDLYLLGSYEYGRLQVQVLNRRDNCCFGENQHTGAGDPNWAIAVRQYEQEVRDSWLGGGFFRVEIDEAATQHEISMNTVVQHVLGEVNRGRRSVGASTATDSFVRGLNGMMWHYNTTTGWANTGLPMIGVPAVVYNTAHPLDVFYRTPEGGIRHAYRDSGGAWISVDIVGKITTDPVAVSWGPGRFDVIAVGRSGGVFHWWWNGSGPVVSESISSTHLGVGIPALATTWGNTLNVAVRARDNTNLLYSMTWTVGQTSWTITPVTSPAPLADHLTMVARPLDALRVFARGGSGQLLQASSPTGSSWTWSTISAPASGLPNIAGSPSASVESGGAVVVRSRLANGNLGIFTLGPSSWSFTNGSGVITNSPTSVPGGAHARGDNVALWFFDAPNWWYRAGYID